MESFNWVIALGAVLFGIIRLIANSNKKQEEQRAPGRKAGPMPGKSFGAGRPKPAGGTFSRMLEELERQLNEGQPSPPVVNRPWAVAQPEATSHDYHSLEEEYNTRDGQVSRSDYSAEDSDAEQRYVGGELRGSGYLYRDEDTDNYYDDEIAAYQRLASERTRRSALASAGVVAAAPSPATVDAAATPVQTDLPAADSTGDNSQNTLRELLGGDFDLRRAVIEAEILNPKYV